MIYTEDYFIEKFERLHDENWLTGAYANHDDTKACALGHCGERTVAGTFFISGTNESSALRIFFETIGCFVGDVNDGMVPAYNQSTPKRRVIAALMDIKKKREYLQKEVVKPERIVYITVDQEVRQLQEEVLIEN